MGPVKNCLYTLILSVCTINTQTNCVIKTIALYSNGRTTICLIGECHNTLYRDGNPCAKSEKRDTQNIFDLMRSASTDKEPVTFVLEANDRDVAVYNKQIQGDKSLNLGALFALSSYADKNGKTVGNAEFIFADKRGPAFRSFDIFSQLFADNFHNLVSPWLIPPAQSLHLPISFDKILTPQDADAICKAPILRDILFDKASPLVQFFSEESKKSFNVRDYTINELFTELNNIMETFHEKMAVTEKNSALREFFSHFHKKVCEGIANAHIFFADVAGDGPTANTKNIVDCIRDAITCKSFTYISNEYIKWVDPLHDIADIGFALAIQDAMQHSNKIIFVGGCNHCGHLQDLIALDDSFQQIIVDENGALVTGRGYSLSQWSDERLSYLFAIINKQLGLITIPRAPANSVQIAPKTATHGNECSACHKSFANLFRCSRCKKVCYCSAECQKKDWVNHKMSCKAQ